MYHCFQGGPSFQILDHIWSSFWCRRKTGVPREKPAEANLDWKQNAHKCRGLESNPELIGAKRGKICCANLLPPTLKSNVFHPTPHSSIQPRWHIWLSKQVWRGWCQFQFCNGVLETEMQPLQQCRSNLLRDIVEENIDEITQPKCHRWANHSQTYLGRCLAQEEIAG